MPGHAMLRAYRGFTVQGCLGFVVLRGYWLASVVIGIAHM